MKTFREFLSEAQSIIEITLDDAEKISAYLLKIDKSIKTQEEYEEFLNSIDVDGFDSDLIDKMIGWPGSKIHYKQRNSAVQELISWYMRSNKL
jgi:hypothetical protein